MKKVYIISKGSHDYSQASKFGEFIYISNELFHIHAVNQMYRLCKDIMIDSKEDDYILLTGLPTLQIIACSYFVSKHNKLNLLLFKNNNYFEKNMIFDSSDHLDSII